MTEIGTYSAAPVRWTGSAIDKGLLLDIGEVATVQAIIYGLDGMYKAGVEHSPSYKKGDIGTSELVVKVVWTGGNRAAIGGAKTALALGLKEGIREVSKRMGWRTLWKASIKHSSVFTAVAYGVVDQSWSTLKYASGSLSNKDFKIESWQNLGSTGGAIGGAATGAAIGSIIPGIGTTVGAVMGGLLGSHGGSVSGRAMAEKYYEDEVNSKE